MCYSNLAFSGPLANLTQAHIHNGTAGVSGDVIVPLFAGIPPATACTPADPAILAQISADPSEQLEDCLFAVRIIRLLSVPSVCCQPAVRSVHLLTALLVMSVCCLSSPFRVRTVHSLSGLSVQCPKCVRSLSFTVRPLSVLFRSVSNCAVDTPQCNMMVLKVCCSYSVVISCRCRIPWLMLVNGVP